MKTHAIRLAVLCLAVLAGPVLAQATFEIGAVTLAEGLTSPVGLTTAGDGSGRLFVIDQIGLIRIIDAGGELLEAPFLDIRDRLVALNENYDERGLLGLAFHPDYAQNGRFFVKYSAPLREEAPDGWSHTNVISEFSVSSDPNLADPDSERAFMFFDHPQGNHDGGTIAFGPDGYLYLGEGDGGGANDTGEGHPPLGNGQDITTLLGTIMRIDVDGEQPYGIPADNPFVGQMGEDEIYAWGFRNPYAFSFDMGGELGLLVGDAGQDMFEEVDQVVLGGNYGWNIREGFHCFDPENPQDPPEECPEVGPNGHPLLPPVVEFNNINNPNGGLANTVVGGFVYRGDLIPEYDGLYIFGGFSVSFEPPNGLILIATPEAASVKGWAFHEMYVVDEEGEGEPGRLGDYVKGFGQDEEGEVYVLVTENAGPAGDTGRVLKFVPADQVPPGGEQDAAVRPRTSGIDIETARGVLGSGASMEGAAAFVLPSPASVQLAVYDIRGRAVRSLVDGRLEAGRHEIAWNGLDARGAPVPSGVYFYKLTSELGAATERVVVVR